LALATCASVVFLGTHPLSVVEIFFIQSSSINL
jgi:hypothetical protein